MYAKAAMIFMSAVLLATVAQARSFTFAYIPHSTTDENFRTAKQGAVRAATEDGNAIREFGRGQAAHPRWQLKAIEEALSRGVDGIILAPLDARVLHEAMRHVPEAQRPPVVVIESDLPEKHHHYRVAYVGTNGVDMGRMMGRLAKRFRPEGGNIALMGSWEGHTSIQLRLWGIRATLGAGRLPTMAV